MYSPAKADAMMTNIYDIAPKGYATDRGNRVRIISQIPDDKL